MNKLLIFSILCSVIGVFIILLVAENTEVDLVYIVDIDDTFVDKEVRVRGKVSSFNRLEGVSLFSIVDDQQIKVVVFDEIDLEMGWNVEIVGRVKEYKSELEIVSDSVRVI